MKKLAILLILLASLPIIAQSKKNKKAVPRFEDLPFNMVTSIETDSLLLSPLVTDSKIFSFTKGNKFNCYNSDGKIIWTKSLSDRLSSKPIFDQSIALLSFVNGDLTKIKIASGQIIESVGIGDSITSNLIKIDYHWQNELMIPKTSNSNSAAIFSTANGAVHCIDLESLQEYWVNHDSPSKLKSHLTSVNDKIIFIGADNSIYCLDAQNGLLIWRWKGNDELIFPDQEIVSDGRYIFLISSDKTLYVIDTLLGKLEWMLEKIKLENPIGIQNDKKNILVLTEDKQLELISIRTHKIVSRIQLPSSECNIIVPPTEFGNKVFLPIGSNLYLIDIPENIIFHCNFEKGEITNLIPLENNKVFLTTGNRNLLIFETR